MRLTYSRWKISPFLQCSRACQPFSAGHTSSVNRLFLLVIGACLTLTAGSPIALAEEETSQPAPETTQEATQPTKAKAKGKQKVMVIPVRSAIDKPALYILRRGLKDAISQDIDTVVIDMETPGGRLDVTFDILQAIEKFPGKTITYVNSEAISAGALISAGTEEIWFAPKGVIGAAAPVLSSGGEIDDTMRQKIVSYLKARIRAITEGKGYRAEVISAMVDSDMEFKIEETVLKEEGELLSLTATEAMELYGEPPANLLATGVADNVNSLLDQLYGKGNYSVESIEPSWSEDLAQYLTAITPLLLSFGLLGLFIEFKTPGFGIFGIAGLILLAIVFFGHHVAGLSGYEPMLLLLIGLLLIAVELFLIPGTMVAGILGAIMVLTSLIWAMLDIWPDQPLELSGDVLTRPLINITLGVAGAVVLFIALLRFLPGGGPWGGMVLQTAIAGAPNGIQPVHSDSEEGSSSSDLIGNPAVAATDLYPSGQVTVDGKRYEARVEVGTVDAGTELVITEVSEFGLVVEPKKEEEKA